MCTVFCSTSRKNRTSCEKLKALAKDALKLKIAPEEDLTSYWCLCPVHHRPGGQHTYGYKRQTRK